MIMLSSSNRWITGFVLLLSVILWLGMSSVMSNSLHDLAKTTLTFQIPVFGSVSIWLVVGGMVWSLIVSYWLVIVTLVPVRKLALSAGSTATWGVTVVVLIYLGDTFLSKLGALAVVVWLVEISVALLLVYKTSKLTLSEIGVDIVLWGMVAVFVWLTAIKALLLILSPGVIIHF